MICSRVLLESELLFEHRECLLREWLPQDSAIDKVISQVVSLVHIKIVVFNRCVNPVL